MGDDTAVENRPFTDFFKLQLVLWGHRELVRCWGPSVMLLGSGLTGCVDSRPGLSELLTVSGNHTARGKRLQRKPSSACLRVLWEKNTLRWLFRLICRTLVVDMIWQQKGIPGYTVGNLGNGLNLGPVQLLQSKAESFWTRFTGPILKCKEAFL